MSTDISCVINAHREADVLVPTIKSVLRAVDYARACGLAVDIHVVMDNSDDVTKDIVTSQLSDLAVIHDVAFKDLAYSRNFAVTQATGRYTSFVDGDDLWCKTWLVDAYVLAERLGPNTVFHPQYNIFFAGDFNHVFNHLDMDDDDYEQEAIYRMNYWTALSFARTDIYRNYQYKKNRILEGFGYEDWTWNYETIADGIKHKTVPGTAHFIRKGRALDSLLELTNQLNALPKILEIYRTKTSPMDEPILDSTEAASNSEAVSEQPLDQDGSALNQSNAA